MESLGGTLELAALSGALPWPKAEAVGGWWNRRFDPEVDLVGADRAPVAGTIFFAGSIKWLASPFDGHDLAATRRAVTRIPGFDSGATGLVVASRGGLGADVERSIDLLWSPEDVVGAWRG
ncbi:hypothetical protein [Actinoallomurus sp. CA-150999]|uniref:hypothetical protein n=1 Tax=Actinoallomurus sp. CA-150999 TaxID=3239887 RepID=UPI003D947EF4